MPIPFIELENITKRFPGVVALDGVSLSIGQGEIFALLGENGAGKSTLAGIIFGIHKPDAGEIVLRGSPVRIDNPSHAAQLDIGMVHQHFNLLDDYSVAENIYLGNEPLRRLLGFIPMIDRNAANTRIQALIDEYGFELTATDAVRDLSVSSKQRVEILKMLYRDAELLIFDEPTAMLTPQEIERLLQIIRRLRDAGKTIILISHKLEEIKQVADRCAIMSRGRLVGVYDVAATSTQRMANLMVGHQLDLGLDKAPPAFGEPVLEVSSLSVIDQAQVRRVDDMSLTIHAGEVFALAGVAGNGQLELADAIAGLLRSSGQIKLAGQDISAFSVRQRIEAGLAYVPEDRQGVGLILDLSLADNLISKGYYRPPYTKTFFLQAAASLRNATDLLDRYDIRSAQGPATIAGQLSGGNQQKLIIARELGSGARLVVFVQPTRGLDIKATLAIRQRIIDESSQGRAVLLISLELEEIYAVADTIGVIYNGRLTKVAAAGDLGIEELGEYMMGVRR